MRLLGQPCPLKATLTMHGAYLKTTTCESSKIIEKVYCSRWGSWSHKYNTSRAAIGVGFDLSIQGRPQNVYY
jgi:hypothetical protein